MDALTSAPHITPDMRTIAGWRPEAEVLRGIEIGRELIAAFDASPTDWNGVLRMEREMQARVESEIPEGADTSEAGNWGLRGVTMIAGQILRAHYEAQMQADYDASGVGEMELD